LLFTLLGFFQISFPESLPELLFVQWACGFSLLITVH